ncbi:MAG: RdgB/HAM1 family non-canonical purine NTP pyrophosphatase [Marinospirillum sp.]|uniref:RdgB/HAM1 family non-canonical purine NTP pyrophosphatase n=1 Tax=Marinospirillum sp. TaxID=2183934 RepID=UPI0019F995D3|nr:RdgB/HAM1 family non-canonical purine NTP pyrophosphatase [Marinospirillum sp.]MBE0506149.1 RdgB/HAM1 family non-canonical purine NTP pyrophosphatase [Marinospirillum sp.]
MTQQKLILASGNAGKLKEFSSLLAPLGWQVEAQNLHQVPEAEETGLTFVENALIKARNAALHTGCAALADDSGVEVDALQGAPGIYSARFAGVGSKDADNNAYLLERLKDVPEAERTARYWCVLVFLRFAEDPTPVIVQASWEGRILAAPRGEGGFGYDPLFWLPELGKTAAEMDKEEKNRISHRGCASQLLIQVLGERFGQQG